MVSSENLLVGKHLFDEGTEIEKIWQQRIKVDSERLHSSSPGGSAFSGEPGKRLALTAVIATRQILESFNEQLNRLKKK